MIIFVGGISSKCTYASDGADKGGTPIIGCFYDSNTTVYYLITKEREIYEWFLSEPTIFKAGKLSPLQQMVTIWYSVNIGKFHHLPG